MRIATTIHQRIYADKAAGGKLCKKRRCQKKRRKRYGSARNRREHIPARVCIERRPYLVEFRLRAGDWERRPSSAQTNSKASYCYVARFRSPQPCGNGLVMPPVCRHGTASHAPVPLHAMEHGCSGPQARMRKGAVLAYLGQSRRDCPCCDYYKRSKRVPSAFILGAKRCVQDAQCGDLTLGPANACSLK